MRYNIRVLSYFDVTTSAYAYTTNSIFLRRPIYSKLGYSSSFGSKHVMFDKYLSNIINI